MLPASGEWFHVPGISLAPERSSSNIHALHMHSADSKPTLRSLSPQQWKSGIAAWLGWTFDGLELHLYTLVALPFVAHLLGDLATTDPSVGQHASIIQGAFLLGWAVGGAFFGRIGDRLGRSRALSLTVLTYAVFTGMSFFATEWWHLMIFRFLAALGVGGEWAVGASLLSETWPKRWRPWIAAVLQCGVNIGILFAVLANHLMAKCEPRFLFLVGILPAILVFWIRRAVPETEEWRTAKLRADHREPKLSELFSGSVLRVTVMTAIVCGISLTAHWAFMFWHVQHLRNLPEVILMSGEERNKLASLAMYLVIGSSIAGNFFSGWLARIIGYRATIGATFFAYFVVMLCAYGVARDHHGLIQWFPVIGFCQGVFGLFTMYLPPLFPTLLRTTGAGFCYNIGRAVSAFGVVFFGLFSKVGDHRLALYYAGFLFLPAALLSFLMPNVRD
jgi:MFS family permease